MHFTTTITIPSRETVEVSLNLLVKDGSMRILPHVEERGLLFLNYRRKCVALSAGPYVGIFPLTDTVLVDVRPKLPVKNLARILELSKDNIDHIPSFSRQYFTETNNIDSVYNFIISNFLSSIKSIIVNGVHKEYVSFSQKTSQLRGKIDLIGTMRECWQQGQQHKVKSGNFRQTTNTPINRIIKSALRSAIVTESMKSETEHSRLEELCAYYKSFPSEIERSNVSDLRECERIISYKKLPEMRSYYFRPIYISLLLLKNFGISLEDQGNDIELNSFIINFENIFESYLRQVLRISKNEQYSVLDGNSDGRKNLFDDTKIHIAQPDIIVKDNQSSKSIVIEVKYKDKPNRNDINQAVTYAVSYRSKIAILLHQKGPQNNGGINHIGKIDGIEILSYAFDLSNENYNEEEENFVTCIINLIK